MDRNILVDRFKGFACFLVLLGHIIRGIEYQARCSIFGACESVFLTNSSSRQNTLENEKSRKSEWCMGK